MKRSAFFIDIDGTLFRHSESEASDQLLAFLRSLAEEHLVVINTGRNYQSVDAIFSKVSDCVLFATSSGASVNLAGREILSAKNISDDHIARCMALADRYGAFFIIATRKTAYSYGQAVKRATDLMKVQRTTLKPIEKIEDIEYPVKLLTLFAKDDNLYPIICREFEGELFAAHSGDRLIDIAISDKGEAARKIMRYFEIPQERTYGFGDSENDMPLLDTVAHPYIMEGSEPELLKRYPDHSADVVETIKELLRS